MLTQHNRKTARLLLFRAIRELGVLSLNKTTLIWELHSTSMSIINFVRRLGRPLVGSKSAIL